MVNAINNGYGHFASKPAAKKKYNNLFGELVQLFDTKGQAIREKEADAKLKALEIAQQQLSMQGSGGVSGGTIALIAVGVVVLLVVLYLIFRKKKS